MDTYQRLIKSELDEDILIICSGHKDLETGKLVLDGGMDKTLMLKITLEPDGDYRINELKNYKFGLTRDDCGDWHGTILFMGDSERDIEERAMIYLTRLAGSIDSDEQEWRIDGTVRGLVACALAIGNQDDFYYSQSPLPWYKLREGDILDYDICDGNQNGCVYAKYIKNKIDMTKWQTEETSEKN